MTKAETSAPALPLRETFPAFYRREFPNMVAIAAAVSGSRAIAEDLAQDAMLRAHRNWDRVSAYERPGAWARRVTINLSLSATKRATAEMRRLVRIAAPPTLPEPDVGDDLIWRAVAKLPGNQRAAIALHYLEDRSIAEIATVLEITEPTARVHLHRGRHTLLTILEEEEVSP